MSPNANNQQPYPPSTGLQHPSLARETPEDRHRQFSRLKHLPNYRANAETKAGGADGPRHVPNPPSPKLPGQMSKHPKPTMYHVKTDTDGGNHCTVKRLREGNVAANLTRERTAYRRRYTVEPGAPAG